MLRRLANRDALFGELLGAINAPRLLGRAGLALAVCESLELPRVLGLGVTKRQSKGLRVCHLLLECLLLNPSRVAGMQRVARGGGWSDSRNLHSFDSDGGAFLR